MKFLILVGLLAVVFAENRLLDEHEEESPYVEICESISEEDCENGDLEKEQYMECCTRRSLMKKDCGDFPTEFKCQKNKKRRKMCQWNMDICVRKDGGNGRRALQGSVGTNCVQFGKRRCKKKKMCMWHENLGECFPKGTANGGR